MAIAKGQTTRFDTLANLPFHENRPTAETAQTLRDELRAKHGSPHWTISATVHLDLPALERR